MDYRFTNPIVMPRGTHYGNDYWIFASAKTKKRQVAYSLLEFYNLLSLEMNALVEFYCPQPVTAEVKDDLGDTRKVTFDVYVVYKDGVEEMQEVKYTSDLSDENEKSLRTKEQIRFERIWAEEHGMNFVVRTEKDIMYNRFVIPNLQYLYSFVKRFQDPQFEELREKVLYFLHDHKYHKIDDIARNIVRVGRKTPQSVGRK